MVPACVVVHVRTQYLGRRLTKPIATPIGQPLDFRCCRVQLNAMRGWIAAAALPRSAERDARVDRCRGALIRAIGVKRSLGVGVSGAPATTRRGAEGRGGVVADAAFS
jgi:hypothetical protein